MIKDDETNRSRWVCELFADPTQPLPGEGKNFRKPTNSQMKRRKAYINNLPKKAMKGE